MNINLDKIVQGMKLNTNKTTHAVYIIHTKPCLDLGLSVYKIGRTCQEYLKRYETYPDGSQLHVQFRVKNAFDVEKQIITIFKECFIYRGDFGREYFEGNLRDMTQKLSEIIYNETEFDPCCQTVSFNTNPLYKEPIMGAADRICPICTKSFISKSNFIIHINRKTPCITPESATMSGQTLKKIKCKRCKVGFKTNQKLTAHMNRQTPCNIKIDQELIFEQLQNEKNNCKTKKNNLLKNIERQTIIINKLQSSLSNMI